MVAAKPVLYYIWLGLVARAIFTKSRIVTDLWHTWCPCSVRIKPTAERVEGHIIVVWVGVMVLLLLNILRWSVRKPYSWLRIIILSTVRQSTAREILARERERVRRNERNAFSTDKLWPIECHNYNSRLQPRRVVISSSFITTLFTDVLCYLTIAMRIASVLN